MKKLIFACLAIFIASLFWIKSEGAQVFPYPQNWEPVQVSSAASPANLGTPLQVKLNPSDNTISNAGVKVCLTELSWSGDGFPATGQTLSILDGSATYYQISVTTYTSGPYFESWPDQHPLCLSANATAYIQISTGNFKVNAQGYKRDF